MRVDSLQTNPSALLGTNQGIKTEAAPKTSFSSALSEALKSANETIVESEKMAEKIATGEITNIHDVTIAAQKAQIAMSLTTQVRDKIVESYQEMMRMQV